MSFISNISTRLFNLAGAATTATAAYGYKGAIYSTVQKVMGCISLQSFLNEGELIRGDAAVQVSHQLADEVISSGCERIYTSGIITIASAAFFALAARHLYLKATR